VRIAVLVKQIPQPGELRLAEGRLVREGLPLETNAFCRRANAQAVALAGDDGEVVVFTMGPPSARQTLEEMIACGAHRGVLISDRALAGSDTLVTAQVLVAGIRREGPFDLVLAGSHSLDAETGQVGPQVAQLLGLPFAGPCRSITVDGEDVRARVEDQGGHFEVELALPAVLATAERLISPSKASDAEIAATSDRMSITVFNASDLGLEEQQIGQFGSPTWVGDVVHHSAVDRARVIVDQPEEAVSVLSQLITRRRAPVPDNAASGPRRAVPPDSGVVLFVCDPRSNAPDLGILSLTSQRAEEAGRSLTAYCADASHAAASGVAAYANRVVMVSGSTSPEDWVGLLLQTIEASRPHALILEGTVWGREVGSRLAASLAWGLVGDAVDLTTRDGQFIPWKSAFAGQAVVPIESRSPVLLVTLRPGSQAQRRPAVGSRAVVSERMEVPAAAAVRYSSVDRADGDAGSMRRAKRLLVVGAGVDPASYEALEPLRRALDAGPLGATRKVTDAGWLPRSRQIGITGASVQPELLVSVGASGRFNHSSGFQTAKIVLAINADADAPVFDVSDVGIVGKWEDIVPRLAAALERSTEWKQAARL
jgi:electron transfer flavoprotein alpha subunit